MAKDKEQKKNDKDIEKEPKDLAPSVDDAKNDLNNQNKPENSTDKNVDKIEDKTISEEIKDPNVGTLKPKPIIEEMQSSYLDYAMSVIVSRALPDVRDGMKPVHRRVLFAMHSTGLNYNSKYRKSAKVVGEVIGNYHPHGDIAVYDTLVRMAQDFSMRYQLVDGQGNFGSMDGDSAAAMRYTECRMSQVASQMLVDIDKDTVDWQDNYDGSVQEPQVLPARVPQLLLNGSMGIAVGMATNIPPHNLNELCDGVMHLIDNPEATPEDLMKFVKGPDFPTGGLIYNKEDIKTAYATGKGKIVSRGKADIEEVKRGFRIVVTEIPYQVNKATLITKMAGLVKDKKLDGISDIRDESDRKGVRVVVELKSNAYPKKILNKLFELTSLQTAFHVNMLALTPDLEPRVMTLKDILEYYIEHRKEVLVRRTKHELKRAKDRAHILEGLKIALDQIDEVISVIKKSQTKGMAKTNLKAKFGLSSRQAEAILEMRLSQLAALERKKIEDEYVEILKQITYLEDLLKNPEKIEALIKSDLIEVKEKFGDIRRTKIVPHALGEFSAEDLIPNQQVIVALTRGNYIKRQGVETYRKQIRGGKGVVGMTTKEEDIIDHLSGCYTHDDIYFFTNKGRVFKSKVYELPATSRQAKGTPVVNIIQLGPNEKVTSLLTVAKANKDAKYFAMFTKNGNAKRTEITKYDNIRKTGIVAMGLKDSDELKWVKTTSGKDYAVEVSEKGMSICYKESDLRPMGRSAAGVRGMKLKGEDRVMAVDIVRGEDADFEANGSKYTGPDMLIVLENGFGKRTMLKHFKIQKRGGSGVKAANRTTKTGDVIGMHITYGDDGDVVLASRKGQFIRMALKAIKRLGRDTQGVTLMRLKSVDKVASVALIFPEVTIEREPKKTSDEKSDKPIEVVGIEKKNLSKKVETRNTKKIEDKPIRTKPKDDSSIKVKTYDKKKVETKSGNTKVTRKEDKNNLDLDFKVNRYNGSGLKKPKSSKNPKGSTDDINYWGSNKKL